MWNFQLFDAGLTVFDQQAADDIAYNTEIKRVTQAMRNDDIYFSCTDGSSFADTAVQAVGIAVPDADGTMDGYVFAREPDDGDLPAYSIMRFTYTGNEVTCVEYAEHMPYGTAADIDTDDMMRRKADGYYELLKPFSDTPLEDIQQLYPQYQPPELSAELSNSDWD